MGLLIEVAVNGEKREIPAGLNIRQMLLHLKLDPQRVAVELNRTIVGKAHWDSTGVEANSSIEIGEFVGGGIC